MNHLEQLVAEWLQYKGYFTRISVLMEKRAGKGGHQAELDVVGFNPVTRRLIHVECSVDASGWAKRRESFNKKFNRPKGYLKTVFEGLDLPDDPDQVVLLRTANVNERIDGLRYIGGKYFLHEILHGLTGVNPDKSAVPSSLPLIRTLQLARHYGGNWPVSPPKEPLVPSENSD